MKFKDVIDFYLFLLMLAGWTGANILFGYLMGYNLEDKITMNHLISLAVFNVLFLPLYAYCTTNLRNKLLRYR